MPTRCYYSVVRYVPDDLRDEAVNIGVLLEAQSQPPRRFVVFANSSGRAASLDPTLERSTIEKLISTFKERLESHAQGDTLKHLVERYSGGRFQLTIPRLSVADDVGAELELLKRQFVLEDEHDRELGCTVSRLRQEIRQLLHQALHRIPDDVIQFKRRGRPLLYRGKTDEHEFDVVLKSPAHTDLVRCITFDVRGYSGRVDAAKVLVYDYDDIRAAKLSGVKVVSVLYPPERFVNGNVKAFETAEQILESKGIPTYDFSKKSDREGFIKIAKRRAQEAGVSLR